VKKPVAPVAAALLGSAAFAQQETLMTTFSFDSDTAGQPPKGFEFGLTGEGRPGNWVVQAVGDAPSGKNVLAQTDGHTTGYRFPIAYTGPELKDLRLSVKCRPVAGKGDQACGIIWRLKDANNYYITRANALEDNVHLYHTVDGRRVKFAGWNGTVTSGVWHDLAMEMVGNHVQVFFDGRRVIDDYDDTFLDAGKFGVWTKADSIVQFDDLTAIRR
jgi:hypothetical protein